MGKSSKSLVAGAVAALATLLIAVYVSFLLQQEFENTVVSQTQDQLLTIAKSTARSLELFIADHLESLQTISNNSLFQEESGKRVSHKVSEPECRLMKAYYEIQKKDIDAVTLLDANGVMLHRYPFWENKKDRRGMDHTDKPGVAYVVREHKAYVSEVFSNNLGNLAISISEPIFDKDRFTGIVRFMISIDTLSKRFIQPVKAGKKGYAYVLDSNGTMLSHPKAEYVGKHIMVPEKEEFSEYDWSELEGIVEKMTKGDEGIGTYHSAWWTEEEFRLIKKLTAYAPVRIGDKVWSVGAVMSCSEIAGPINRHARNIFGLAAIVMALFMAGGAAFFRIRKKKVELETEAKYLKQIANGAEALRESEEHLTKYAADLEEARNNLEQKVEKRTQELKEAHEALIRKEKLAVLGQLSSGVAHELRHPLGVIKNACYFLNMKIETIRDEAVKDNIAIMNREIDIANKIITDLLDFARITPPMRQDTDINQLVTETLSETSIPENITVTSDLVEGLSPVSIDAIQVGQIFLNLIENGVHAMVEGGTLDISSRMEEGVIEVIFVDKGCGISRENMEKIFEPLFTTKAKGIGLGLSISKSLAKANGATILVESEDGKGSRFTVRFRD